MAVKTYKVNGMDCADCAETITKGVSRMDGVTHIRVDYVTGKMVIEGEVPESKLRQRVEALGYGLGETEEKHGLPKRGGIAGYWDHLIANRETRFALAGAALVLLAVLYLLVNLDDSLSELLFMAAAGVAGYPIARSGLNALFINRDFNINFLMTIAAVGAILMGEAAEGAAVVLLFAFGEALEGYTTGRARDSIGALMQLSPPTALRVTEAGEQIVPVEMLNVGDTIIVKPGERIPMDGLVLSGESDVNQAPITGESVPVHKAAQSAVYAGTVNGTGLLTIRVTRLASDNTLSRIVKLVEEAQSTRARSQRLIDRFARIYTPSVVIIATFIAIIPPLLFNQPFLDASSEAHGWLYRALALLVIACPCALVISAPVTVISGITAAARRGILIKGGAALESLGIVKAFAFDKTGTLTRGQPTLTARHSVDCATGEDCAHCDDVLALASAVEGRVSHPLAYAVVEAAEARGLSGVYAPAEDVELLAGQGVRGHVGDMLVTVGSHSLFDAQYPHDRALCDLVRDAESHGQTAMLLSADDKVRGFVTVADSVREDSRRVINELKALGSKMIMLTGDNATVAQAVAAEIGVDDVRAGLMPEDKVAAVKALTAQYGAVAMVGDGVNDTPALAAATVSVAMGGAGSAQALETADIALMADDLSQLPFAVRLSRFSRSVLIQNIALSLGIKLVFMTLALVGGTSLWLAILADDGVLLLVTLNGMRPLRFK